MCWSNPNPPTHSKRGLLNRSNLRNNKLFGVRVEKIAEFAVGICVMGQGCYKSTFTLETEKKIQHELPMITLEHILNDLESLLGFQVLVYVGPSAGLDERAFTPVQGPREARNLAQGSLISLYNFLESLATLINIEHLTIGKHLKKSEAETSSAPLSLHLSGCNNKASFR